MFKTGGELGNKEKVSQLWQGGTFQQDSSGRGNPCESSAGIRPLCLDQVNGKGKGG